MAGICSQECAKVWNDFDSCSEKSIISTVEQKIRECVPQCAGQSDPGCMLQCVDTWRPVAAGFESCLSGLPAEFRQKRNMAGYGGMYTYTMTDKQKKWAIAGGVGVVAIAVIGVGYYLYSRK